MPKRETRSPTSPISQTDRTNRQKTGNQFGRDWKRRGVTSDLKSGEFSTKALEIDCELDVIVTADGYAPFRIYNVVVGLRSASIHAGTRAKPFMGALSMQRQCSRLPT